MLSKSILVRLALTILLIITLLIIINQSSSADTTYTLTVTGNNDQVVFTVSPLTCFQIPVIWGVSGQVGQQQTINIINGQAVVTPPINTVSIQLGPWPGYINVTTLFTQLNNEGWYAVPAAYHTITITGDVHQLVFETNFTPREDLSILLGISNQPAQRVILDFIGTTATLIPPPGTVSLLFNHTDVTVITDFPQLSPDGWYRIPLAQLPVLNQKVFLPITYN